MMKAFGVFAILVLMSGTAQGLAQEPVAAIQNSVAEFDLQYAIERGEVSGVQKALSQITDIDSVRLKGEFTPLQYACLRFNNSDAVSRQILALMLPKYSRFDQVGFGSWQGNHQFYSDWPPLMIAYAFQAPDFINDLKKAGAKLDHNKSLFAASRNTHTGLVKNLLANGANANYRVNTHGFEQKTPLMFSSDENIDLLLSAGADPNLLDIDDNSALHIASSPYRIYDAIYRISPSSLQKIISAGAKVDQQNKDGDTALIFAVKSNLPEFAEILLSAGALTELRNEKKQTALIINSDLTPFWKMPDHWDKPKRIAIAKALIQHGAKVEQSLWQHVFFRPDYAYTQVLLSSGVDVNFTSQDGSSPLMLSVDDNAGSAEIVQLLVDHGGNINYRHALSVLDIAVKNNDLHKVAVLINAGVLLDDQDPDDGHTALMFAAMWGKYDSVEYLIDAGASLNMKDKSGKTALDHAWGSDVRNLIKQAGGLPGDQIP